jgi:hypothetical protein
MQTAGSRVPNAQQQQLMTPNAKLIDFTGGKDDRTPENSLLIFSPRS